MEATAGTLLQETLPAPVYKVWQLVATVLARKPRFTHPLVRAMVAYVVLPQVIGNGVNSSGIAALSLAFCNLLSSFKQTSLVVKRACAILPRLATHVAEFSFAAATDG